MPRVEHGIPVPDGMNYVDVVINGRKHTYHTSGSVRGLDDVEVVTNGRMNHPSGVRDPAGVCLVKCYNPGGPSHSILDMDKTDEQIRDAHLRGEQVIFEIVDPEEKTNINGWRFEATAFEFSASGEFCTAKAYDMNNSEFMIYNGGNGKAFIEIAI